MVPSSGTVWSLAGRGGLAVLADKPGYKKKWSKAHTWPRSFRPDWPCSEIPYARHRDTPRLAQCCRPPPHLSEPFWSSVTGRLALCLALPCPALSSSALPCPACPLPISFVTVELPVESTQAVPSSSCIPPKQRRQGDLATHAHRRAAAAACGPAAAAAARCSFFSSWPPSF